MVEKLLFVVGSGPCRDALLLQVLRASDGVLRHRWDLCLSLHDSGNVSKDDIEKREEPEEGGSAVKLYPVAVTRLLVNTQQ